MWDKSSQLMGRIRPALGGVALLTAVALPFFFETSNPQVVLANASDATQMLVTSEADQLRAVDAGDATIAKFDGALIYREREDGTGEIVGSMKVRDGVLYAHINKDTEDRVELAWHAPVRSLSEGIELIFGADEMQKEVDRLRELIIPIVNEHMFTPMKARLSNAFDEVLEDLVDKREAQLTEIANGIKAELAPEIEELSNKLVETAWEKIGVWGVAEGLWRKGSSAIGSAAKGAWKGVKGFFGDDDDDEGEEEATPFLSDERKKELREALEADIEEYWNDNREGILEKGKTVLNKHDSLRKEIEKEISDRFSAIAIEVFEQNKDQLTKPLTNFANDVGLKHLVTKDGAPRLGLAYAIRSGAGLTHRPLVVLRPAKTAGETLRMTQLNLQTSEKAAE